MRARGTPLGDRASVLKFVGAELNKRRAELMLQLEPLTAMQQPAAGLAPDSSARRWLRSKGNSIEGGTSEIMQSIIEDARARGTITTGGRTLERPGYFIEPTVFRDIAEGTRLVDEEQFGPVVPLIAFEDEADAVRRANASTFGLGGSVWSKRPGSRTGAGRNAGLRDGVGQSASGPGTGHSVCRSQTVRNRRGVGHRKLRRVYTRAGSERSRALSATVSMADFGSRTAADRAHNLIEKKRRNRVSSTI